MSFGFGKTEGLFLQRQLSLSTFSMGKSLQKLSTGYRINSAADDAAGLSISEGLLSQINSMEQNIRNSQDGYSLLTIADGATSTITENLQRIRELTVQAANDTLGTSERNAIAGEISQRQQDIDRIADTTEFNGTNLLNASAPASMQLQVGPGSTLGQDTLDIAPALGDSSSTAIGLTAAASVTLPTASAARDYLDKIDTALSNINSRRSSIGAMQNRLDSVTTNLSVTSMNLSSANSRIRDTDIASETSKLVKQQLLQQFNVSLMSQLNSSSSNLTLSLLSSINR